MSEQQRWPRPLRVSFRIAMREKPPEVIRNKEFLEELRERLRQPRPEPDGPPLPVEEFLASLHEEVARREREQRRANSAG